MQKTKIIVVISLIAAVIIGASALIWFLGGKDIFFIENKPLNNEPGELEETINLLTYINTKYGYKVQYSGDWLGGETISDTEYAIFTEEPPDIQDGMRPSLSVRVFNNSDHTPVLDWWEEWDSKDGVTYERRDNVYVDGLLAFKFQEVGAMQNTFVILVKGSYIFMIFRTGFTDGILDDFIASFSFNDIWKTYINEEYSFEIDYPIGWSYGETRGSNLTPFGVDFSDDQAFVEYGRMHPNQPFPDKYVNLVLYQTSDSLVDHIAKWTIPGFEKLQEEEIEVSGLTGRFIRGKGTDGIYRLYVYVKNGEYVYFFESLVNKEDGLTEAEQIFSYMISSFEFIRIYKFPSVDGAYTFVHRIPRYTETVPEVSCAYSVWGSKGEMVNVERLAGSDTISCSWSLGIPTSRFYGWVDGNKFLVNETKGEIRIIDVNSSSYEAYKYDSNDLIFRLANHSLEYWLFRKGPEGAHILFDRNYNIVIDKFKETVNRPVLYDPINDGFMFISRTQPIPGHTSVVFDFLNLANLSIKNVLTTDPELTPGRGCYPEKIISSQIGEISLTQGCLTVGDKYLDENGNIRLEL